MFEGICTNIISTRTCTGCNNPFEQPFDGRWSQGAITITRSNMRWSGDAGAPSGTDRSYLNDDIIVFADIVGGR